MRLSIASLLVPVVTAIEVEPVLTRIFREAVDRNPNAPDDGKDGDHGRL